MLLNKKYNNKKTIKINEASIIKYKIKVMINCQYDSNKKNIIY